MKQFTQAQYLRAQKREDVFTLTCLVISSYLIMALVFLKL